MAKKPTTRIKIRFPFFGFRLRGDQQKALRDQFQREIRQIPPDDPIMVTRLKHKYRRRGLRFD